MSKKSRTLAVVASALLFSMLGATAANAGVIDVRNGNIGEITDVDIYAYDLVAGDYTFDILAWGHRDTYLDASLAIFDYTNSVVGALLAFNDDSWPAGQADGSTSGLDSFIRLTTTGGRVRVAVCSFYCGGIDGTSGSQYANPTGGSTGRFRLTVSRVPEPGTLALLGLGLAGIGFSRRKIA